MDKKQVKCCYNCAKREYDYIIGRKLIITCTVDGEPNEINTLCNEWIELENENE